KCNEVVAAPNSEPFLEPAAKRSPLIVAAWGFVGLVALSAILYVTADSRKKPTSLQPQYVKAEPRPAAPRQPAIVQQADVQPIAERIVQATPVAETQVIEQPEKTESEQEQVPVLNNEIVGKVVGVTDGDTITVLDGSKTQHKIRLEGIDAPESGQPMGAKSKQALSDKVFGKTVSVKWREHDKYKRVLGHIYVDDRYINHAMVEEGWAWHYKKYSSDEDLAEAEIAARQKKIGLWSYEKSIPPWEWRAPKKVADDPKPTTKKIADQSNDDDSVVYITKTGKKYHSGGCRYLSKSQIPIKLSDAISQGYTACSVCGGAGHRHEAEPSREKPTARSDETPSGTTATGKTIYTGPRGGRYHYSKSGKKVYERKKR
ncbi:MAG: thermonuclease family protein, partial [Planctomycetaceae bacterium]